jgi:hypothetical protein
MMRYQFGDALLRNSYRIRLGHDPVPSCKTSWTQSQRL